MGYWRCYLSLKFGRSCSYLACIVPTPLVIAYFGCSVHVHCFLNSLNNNKKIHALKCQLCTMSISAYILAQLSQIGKLTNLDLIQVIDQSDLSNSIYDAKNSGYLRLTKHQPIILLRN